MAPLGIAPVGVNVEYGWDGTYAANAPWTIAPTAKQDTNFID